MSGLRHQIHESKDAREFNNLLIAEAFRRIARLVTSQVTSDLEMTAINAGDLDSLGRSSASLIKCSGSLVVIVADFVNGAAGIPCG